MLFYQQNGVAILEMCVEVDDVGCSTIPSQGDEVSLHDANGCGFG